jgi:peptidoglycan L-alanyl-D-glutamate endopeptidase CwlK
MGSVVRTINLKIQIMEDKISLARLNLLHPLIREDAIKAYNEAVKATPVGVHPFITQTIRSFAESDALYAQGRTKPGPIVSYAKGGQSYHNYGLALDFVNIIGGKYVWPKRPEQDENWMTVVNIFKKYGFEAGIDWKGKKRDAPHFQRTFGYDWRDLLALHNAGKVEDEYVTIKLPATA